MRSDQPVTRGATAGALFPAAIIACEGVGYGIGSLIGAAVPLATVALFADFVAGFELVYARCKDL
jgi:hypothetical protein